MIPSEARKAGIPVELLSAACDLHSRDPEAFEKLHRDISQRAANLEAVLLKLKDAASVLEASIEHETKTNGESMQLVQARLQLKDLKQRIANASAR